MNGRTDSLPSSHRSSLIFISIIITIAEKFKYALLVFPIYPCRNFRFASCDRFESINRSTSTVVYNVTWYCQNS